MGVSRALKTDCQTPIDLSRIELLEQLIHHQSGVLLRLKNGLNLSPTHYDPGRVRASLLYHGHHTRERRHWPSCCSQPP
jgi:hypothetical protein